MEAEAPPVGADEGAPDELELGELLELDLSLIHISEPTRRS